VSTLLTATLEELSPRGRPLPVGEYVVTVEQAQKEGTQNGVQWSRRYNNIRTTTGQTEFTLPDGSTFRIGNRKLFARSWITHTNSEAQRIGNVEILKEAIATGLADKPTKDSPTVLLFDLSTDDGAAEYQNALVGKEVRVRVKHRSYESKELDPATGKPVVKTEAEIADYLPL
jgi:hypothetical protein